MVACTVVFIYVQYSGKYLLVQNFIELPPNPSEERLVVLNFKSLKSFVVLIFAAADLSMKSLDCEIL